MTTLHLMPGAGEPRLETLGELGLADAGKAGHVHRDARLQADRDQLDEVSEFHAVGVRHRIVRFGDRRAPPDYIGMDLRCFRRGDTPSKNIGGCDGRPSGGAISRAIPLQRRSQGRGDRRAGSASDRGNQRAPAPRPAPDCSSAPALRRHRQPLATAIVGDRGLRDELLSTSR